MKISLYIQSFFISIALFFAQNTLLAFGTIEKSDTIIVDAKTYKLVFIKSNCSWSVIAHDRVLLSTVPKKSILLKENSLDHFSSFKQVNDSVIITYITPSQEQVDIVIFPTEKEVYFKIKTPENTNIGLQFENIKNCCWYGGNITSAGNWPSNKYNFTVDPFFAASNQTSPIWFCSTGAGLLVKTVNTMAYAFQKDANFSIEVKDVKELQFQVAIAANIKEAHEIMMETVGRPSVVPLKEYFSNAIFNSWIEFKTEVNEKGLLEYSQKIRNHKIPCTVLEIDDKWTPAYGEFDFDFKKFPQPGNMVEKLHAQGFKVALWMTPFVEKKAKTFDVLLSKKFLIMEPDGKNPYITTWWNGEAALIDLSNPDAYQWFLGQLQNLSKVYKVDGFKLDAGDADFLSKAYKSYNPMTPNEYADLFASVGTYFEINELRVSWFTQKLGLVQRLRDKNSDWSTDKGLGSLIPHGITEGLIGYPYFCPDMIGGGEIANFTETNQNGVNAELFIRWTQASSLMPMMQYSYAPWKLDSASFAICKKYTDLHSAMGDYIYSLAQEASKNGKPIARALFYEFPEDTTCYSIMDQFMLGSRFLVAPVLLKGAIKRNIYLPSGAWADFWTGAIYKGGSTIENYPAPIDILPIFKRINN